MSNVGPIAFVGGEEWHEGCEFDERLVGAASNGNDPLEVVVVPAASAYERPREVTERAATWFRGMGASARGLDLLTRRDAENPEYCDVLRHARMVYLAEGSSLHLRSVLKDSAAWHAIDQAWRNGAVIAGSGAGAMVLGDPMVDPRGGAMTLGLGFIRNLALVPKMRRWTPEWKRRMLQLVPAGVVVAEVPERNALVRWGDGTWEALGASGVTVLRDGEELSLGELSEHVTTGAPTQ